MGNYYTCCQTEAINEYDCSLTEYRSIDHRSKRSTKKVEEAQDVFKADTTDDNNSFIALGSTQITDGTFYKKTIFSKDRKFQ